MARINPNSSPQSGQLFDTEIPDFSDNANIQEALRMYHYGNANASVPTTANGIGGGIAGFLQDAYESISELEQQGIGSSFSSSAPTGVPAGYVWVNSTSSSPQSFASKTVYQTSQPTSELFDGMLWIDKDSTPLKMYVYDSQLGWREVGA